jgi:hypothetical protein
VGAWNVRGWRINRKQVVEEMGRVGLGVLVVSEPWVKGKGRVPGFSWLVGDYGSKSGKVAVLVKKSLEVNILERECSRRVVWVRVRGMGSGGSDLLVAGVYGYCDGTKRRKAKAWWTRLQEQIGRMEKEGEVLVTGDFNARIGKMGGENGEEKVNWSGRVMMSLVEECGLEVCNGRSDCEGRWTRVQGERRSVIDYVLGEWRCRESNSRVRVEEGSGGGGLSHTDHKLVWVERNKATVGVESCGAGVVKWCLESGCKWEEYRLKLGATEALMASGLQAANVERERGEVLGQGLVDAWWKELADWLRNGALGVVKQKLVGGRQRLGGLAAMKKKRWWNGDVERLWRRKMVLYAEYMVTLKGEERVGAVCEVQEEEAGGEERRKRWAKFRKAEAELRRAVRRAKTAEKQQWVKKVEEKSGRELWRGWRKKSGRESGLPATVKLGAERRNDVEGVKQLSARFFESLGTETAGEQEKHDDEWRAKVEKWWEEKGEGEEMEDLDNPIEEQEVSRSISRLKSGKAAGIDTILPEFLKEGGKVVEQRVGELIGVIWREEVVPGEWKEGLVMPVYKGEGDEEDYERYRGITLLCVASKVLEGVLKERLERWAEKEGKVAEEQGGFRRGRGCPEVVWLAEELVRSRSERGELTWCAFLDVRKAYDVVWWKGLWWQLWEAGVRGKMLRVVSGMYEGLQSAVMTRGGLSGWFVLRRGVKQGGVLSPWLYSMYINGVMEELRRKGLGVCVEGRWVGALLYADDIMLLARTREELQEMVRVVEEYAAKWRFELAAAKCEVVVYGQPRRVVGNESVLLGGVDLKVSGWFKYLGMELESRRGWGVVAERVLMKARKKAAMLKGVLRQGKWRESVEVKRRLWEAVVRPVLVQGGEVWEPVDRLREKLECEQRKGGRMVLGVGGTTSNVVVLGELGWMTIRASRDEALLRMVGKIERMDGERLVKEVYVRGKGRWLVGKVGRDRWWGRVHRVCELWGLGDMWKSGLVEGMPKARWEGMVRERMCAREVSVWKERMSAGGVKMELYRVVKKTWGREEYISAGSRRSVAFKCALRSGTCGLEVELGRGRLTREERVCRVCGEGVEDVVHFVMSCNGLRESRERWWKKLGKVLSRSAGGRQLWATLREWWCQGRLCEVTAVVLGSEGVDRGVRREIDSVVRVGLWAMRLKRNSVLGV